MNAPTIAPQSARSYNHSLATWLPSGSLPRYGVEKAAQRGDWARDKLGESK